MAVGFNHIEMAFDARARQAEVTTGARSLLLLAPASANQDAGYAATTSTTQVMPKGSVSIP